MNSIPQSADAKGYLENLMRAGQDAVKQFDDVLAAAGVRSEELASSGRLLFPFGLIVDFERDSFKLLWRLWNAMPFRHIRVAHIRIFSSKHRLK